MFYVQEVLYVIRRYQSQKTILVKAKKASGERSIFRESEMAQGRRCLRIGFNPQSLAVLR